MKFEWYVVAQPKDNKFDEWVVVAGFVAKSMARVYREHVSLIQKGYSFKVVEAEVFDIEYIILEEGTK